MKLDSVDGVIRAQSYDLHGRVCAVEADDEDWKKQTEHVFK